MTTKKNRTVSVLDPKGICSLRLTAIRSLVTARRALLELGSKAPTMARANEIGEEFEKLGEVLANLRKPHQPTKHTHGPLKEESEG